MCIFIFEPILRGQPFLVVLDDQTILWGVLFPTFDFTCCVIMFIIISRKEKKKSLLNKKQKQQQKQSYSQDASNFLVYVLSCTISS